MRRSRAQAAKRGNPPTPRGALSMHYAYGGRSPKAVTRALLTGSVFSTILVKAWRAGSGGTALAELSFAAPAQPFEVDYFVEVVALELIRFRSVFSGYTSHSAILVPLPQSPGSWVWRVSTVAKSVPDYVPSVWKYFSVR